MQSSVMGRIVVVVCVLLPALIFAQISSTARLQPYPVEVGDLGQCCGYTVEEERTGALLRCVNQTLNSDSGRDRERDREPGAPKVTLLSYVSAETNMSLHFAVPDILDFASYHAALVTAYARHNKYDYKFITPDMAIAKGAVEHEDIRWTKVKLLIDALDPIVGWARDSEFVAWIDADAVLLDFGMRLETIANDQFPGAHFLASADIRQGYINSGFLLVRNSAWLRSFLQRWWDAADRATVCDQDAFDIVYTAYSREEKEREEKKRARDRDEKGVSDATAAATLAELIRILPRDALNTDPPASLRQKPENQVLHLMGESTALRVEVFRQGWQQVCKSISSSTAGGNSGGNSNMEVLPSQLGLHRMWLTRTSLQAYRGETARRVREMAFRLENVRKNSGITGLDKATPANKNQDGPPDAPKRSGLNVNVGVEVDGNGDSIYGEGEADSEMSENRWNAVLSSAAVVASAPAEFELLGRTAHHLCDLLAAHDASSSGSEGTAGDSGDSGGGSTSGARQEAFDVRLSVFQLSLDWLHHAHALLGLLEKQERLLVLRSGRSGLDSGSDSPPTDSGGSGSGVEGLGLGLEQGMPLKAMRSGVAGVLLQLLKRAAEAGNDVFGAALSEQQRRQAAGRVFRLLEELHSRVDKQSQVVPAHMQALMHQNMAYMDYELAVAAGGDNATATATTDTGGGGSSSGTGPPSRNQKQVKLFNSARAHAQKSAEIFTSSFGLGNIPSDSSTVDSNSPSPDKSVRGEYVQTLQVLAAVHCADGASLGKGAVSRAAFAEGLVEWERAIETAEQNMHGVVMGPALDLFGGVLHNAAVCQLQAADALAEGGTNAKFRAKLVRAEQLANLAVQVRETYSSQQGLGLSTFAGVDTRVSNPILALSRELLGTVRARIGRSGGSGDRDRAAGATPSLSDGGSRERDSEGEGAETHNTNTNTVELEYIEYSKANTVFHKEDFLQQGWLPCREGDAGCADIRVWVTEGEGEEPVREPLVALYQDKPHTSDTTGNAGGEGEGMEVMKRQVMSRGIRSLGVKEGGWVDLGERMLEDVLEDSSIFLEQLFLASESTESSESQSGTGTSTGTITGEINKLKGLFPGRTRTPLVIGHVSMVVAQLEQQQQEREREREERASSVSSTVFKESDFDEEEWEECEEGEEGCEAFYVMEDEKDKDGSHGPASTATSTATPDMMNEVGSRTEERGGSVKGENRGEESKGEEQEELDGGDDDAYDDAYEEEEEEEKEDEARQARELYKKQVEAARKRKRNK